MKRTKYWLGLVLTLITIATMYLYFEEMDMTQITLKPTVDKVRVGVPFDYVVEITPDTPIAGGQLNLHFNPVAMKVLSVEKGNFYGSIPCYFNAGTINNALGTVEPVFAAALGAGNAVSAKGTFVIFHCLGLKAVDPQVALSDVVLGNKEGQSVPFALAVTQVVLLAGYDLDGNGFVDVADVTLAVAQFGKPGTADFNEDGIVNILDIVLIGQNFT